MATMNCDKFLEGSGAWMEGERHPDAATHLADCARCRTMVADLETIRDAGQKLFEEEPPPHLWMALRAQLEKEGLIRRARANWWERLTSIEVLRPALAGAYLAVLAAASVFFAWQGNMTSRTDQALWLDHTQTATAPLAAELQTVEEKTMPVLRAQSPDVTATLNRNLAIVDNMISLCEKSVREDPQNEMTRDYLYSAYQQKADLLTTMADNGANSR